VVHLLTVQGQISVNCLSKPIRCTITPLFRFHTSHFPLYRWLVLTGVDADCVSFFRVE